MQAQVEGLEERGIWGLVSDKRVARQVAQQLSASAPAQNPAPVLPKDVLQDKLLGVTRMSLPPAELRSKLDAALVLHVPMRVVTLLLTERCASTAAAASQAHSSASQLIAVP